jgi:lipopolysaccharide biosynthesis glycosyltransferase
MTNSLDVASFPESEPIVLVCAADDNYAMPLAVTLRSALENLGDGRTLSIFIIDGGIQAEKKQKIAQSIQSDKVTALTWLNPNEDLLTDVEVSSYYSKAIFYRLLIPELLPEFSKAIYLDSDVIVNADLGKLWDSEIKKYHLLASIDLYRPPILSPGYKEFLRDQNISNPKIFNTGVLLMNLAKWRSDQVATDTVEHVFKYKLFSDQEGLNIALKDKWKDLDPRWNRTACVHEYDSWEKSPFSEDEFNNLVNHPYIIHFTSADKPWNSIDRCPEQELFYHYLDMTAWAGWRFTHWKRLQRRLTREVQEIQKKLLPE